MSRGPGRWQRAILAALKTRDHVFSWEILPRAAGRSQRFVFRRAAQRLAEQGLVTIETRGLDICVTPVENSRQVSHLDTAEVSVTSLQNSGGMSHLGTKEAQP